MAATPDIKKKDSMVESGDKWEAKKVSVEKFLDSTVMQVVMGVITIYALFGDDVRVLVTNANGDPVFWVLNCIVFVVFSLEIVVNCIVKVTSCRVNLALTG